jgi:hypothetical protein
MAYKKPPEHTKFRPGQSGNPKGRSPKLPGLDELLADVLGEETDGTTTAKKILIALAKKAMKGDTRSAEILLERGYGRAKQSVDLSGSVTMQGTGFDYSALSNEDLEKVTQIISKYSTHDNRAKDKTT